MPGDTAPKDQSRSAGSDWIVGNSSLISDLVDDVESDRLRGPSGAPLNLDNLARRVIRPLLDAAKIEWHGWYACRRGVATTLTPLQRDSGQSSKGLLRHTSLATTLRHYIKDVPENTLQAMNHLEALFSQCSTTKQ